MPLRPVLLTALAVSLAACGDRAPAPAADAPVSVPFEIEGQLQFLRDGAPIAEIAIEIADTDSTIQRGLMDRDVIPPETGMLFVMPRTDVLTFYMANTPRSLDILFFGEDSSFVSAATYTTPFSHETLASAGPARYVVEVPAGFADNVGIRPGDRIDWQRSSPLAAPVSPAPGEVGANGDPLRNDSAAVAR